MVKRKPKWQTGTLLTLAFCTGSAWPFSTFRNIGVNQYTTLTGGQPISGVVPTSSLPEAVQNLLTAPTNPGTAGQRAINDRTPPGDCADFGQVLTLLTRVGLVAGPPPAPFVPQPPTVVTIGPGPELLACTSQPCPAR